MSEKLWNGNYVKVWLANFMLHFSFMLLTPLFPLYLSDTFNADNQMIGVVLAGYTVTALLVRPFSGYLVDSFSRRTILLGSFFLFFLLMVAYPFATSILLFAIVRTLHGLPFGVATVSNSTVAIDVLPSSRRAEGIGYYGLSNNLATALGPSIALVIYGATGNWNALFGFAILLAFFAFYSNYKVHFETRPTQKRQPISFDRFILTKAWRQGLCMVFFSMSYGIISAYIAIYAKEELGITGGTGIFFLLLSTGLILSRLVGSRTLRKGKITQNASLGVLISLMGYLLFASCHNIFACYGAALIIGLGNGHMFPAFQTMFLNLASNEQRGTANSTLYVSWDIGIGLGILSGGILSEHLGYHSAFWLMWCANLSGVLCYFLLARSFFLQNKLR